MSTTTVPSFDLGDLVRISGAWQTSAGEYTDPTVVKVKIKSPDPEAAVIEYTYGTDAAIVKDNTGRYHADVNANAEGRWFYKWYSTGTGQAAAEFEFVVERSQFS